jgi:ribosomal protein L24E
MMYVKNDGTILWFCSGKCKKSSLSFGRDARKLKWTNTSAKKKKEKPKPQNAEHSTQVFSFYSQDLPDNTSNFRFFLLIFQTIAEAVFVARLRNSFGSGD